MNLQENIQRIREMMGMDDSRLTFDIQKLVDDGIIFVTEPGDGQGGIAKPNWEGDSEETSLSQDNKTIWKISAVRASSENVNQPTENS